MSDTHIYLHITKSNATHRPGKIRKTKLNVLRDVDDKVPDGAGMHERSPADTQGVGSSEAAARRPGLIRVMKATNLGLPAGYGQLDDVTGMDK